MWEHAVRAIPPRRIAGVARSYRALKLLWEPSPLREHTLQWEHAVRAIPPRRIAGVARSYRARKLLWELTLLWEHAMRAILRRRIAGMARSYRIRNLTASTGSTSVPRAGCSAAPLPDHPC